MKYQSKKDPEIFAALDFQNEKTKTYRMIYLTGDKAGYSFEVSASTLKRWWEQVNATKEEVDAEIINTPYHPDVTPHYIPKPQSVIEYEENKKRKRYNNDLPDFDNMVEDLMPSIRKVNKDYVLLKDSATAIWRKGTRIDVNADSIILEKCVKQGLKSTENKDKDRPFRITIVTIDDYEKLKKAILN